MTGYAVTFNPPLADHKRIGHLFQNRYKSIVCEEDPYLMELVRYIHLNPLRAGLVKDLNELDRYPWGGHSALLGKRKNHLMPNKPKQRNKPDNANEQDRSLAEKTIEDVLLQFGNTYQAARRRYREFVKKGVNQGKRPELHGGGLIRSAGGSEAGLLGRKKEERDPPASSERAQARDGGRARSVLACVAVRMHGYKGVEITEALSLSSPTVSRIIEKGEFLLLCREILPG